MRKSPLLPLLACVVVCGLSASAFSTSARAQTAEPQTTPDAPKQPKKKYDPHASPLEVIKDFRLWTNPPPAKDFVRETRPDPKTLEYTPLTGKDPVRPKPRDQKGVEDLRAELEKDMQTNADKGKAVTDRMQATAAEAAAKAPRPASALTKVAHKRKKPVEATTAH